ncbi:hypothetical protein AHiyo8_02500 [Arthrobacter sp. Hiyo8]|nr:hypothetical protein AHiyo8_02500 [Arthrobacter sp. Hiyo8]
MNPAAETEFFETVIAGVGFGGIAAAHDLLESGRTDFVLLEKAPKPGASGGTTPTRTQHATFQPICTASHSRKTPNGHATTPANGRSSSTRIALSMSWDSGSASALRKPSLERSGLAKKWFGVSRRPGDGSLNADT